MASLEFLNQQYATLIKEYVYLVDEMKKVKNDLDLVTKQLQAKEKSVKDPTPKTGSKTKNKK